MKKYLSMILAICLVATFVFCQPMHVMAAEAEEGTEDVAGTVPGDDTTTEGDAPVVAPTDDWTSVLPWTDGLPAPIAVFVAAVDMLFAATLQFAKSLLGVFRYFIPFI